MKINYLPRLLFALAMSLSFMSMANKDCLTVFNETVNQSLDEAHENVRECHLEPMAIASYCEYEAAIKLNHEINGAINAYENCED